MLQLDLKPCPFCENATLSFWDYSVLNSLDTGVSVYCPRCGARGPKEPNVREAAECWNRGVA